MIKDMITFHVEKVCDNCKKHHLWSDLKDCIIDEDFGYKCLNCYDPMITNLFVTIGAKQEIPYKTSISENQSFLSIKGLRTYINELYDTRLESAEIETFDLMIFREISKQLFYNFLFYMIDHNLPYDIVMPYEDNLPILKYKLENYHINIKAVTTEDKFTLMYERSRRNKSEIPHF